jgi:hypothetical protein
MMVMRLFIAALIVFIAAPALAEEKAVSFPVSIPQECVVLAQREGVPTTIENKYQAAKAKLKLARMSNSEPMVQECRAAVERHRRAGRAARVRDAKKPPGAVPGGS